jgi:hypothetical protein
MKEKFAMKPYVWYSRPEGNKGEHFQYGIVTDHPEIQFSIYFAPTPWGDQKNNSITFADFTPDPTSYTQGLDKFEPSGMDSYLWLLVAKTKFARQAIVRIFGGDYVRIK